MYKLELKHKIFAGLFLLVFLAYMVIHYINHCGIYFDIPSFFLSAYFNHPNFYLLIFPEIIRNIPTVLVSVVYNLLHLFSSNVNSVLNDIKLFSLSFFVVQWFALYLNWLVAKRTKRYDIFYLAFAFYAMFCIPNFMWNIKEFYIAFLFNFVLLTYYFSDTKLSKTDLVLSSILALLMFEMSELNFVISVFLILFTLFFIRKYKNEKNNTCKILISAFSIFPLLYIPIKAYYICTGPRTTALTEWRDNFINAFSNNLTTTIALSFIFAFISVVILFFLKKDLTYKSIPFISIFLLICAGIFQYRVGFSTIQFNRELSNYMISFLCFFIIFAFILCKEYFNFKMENFNKNFYKNLFLVSCIFGILNLSWQIHNCIEFGKYSQFLKDKINKSNEKVYVLPITNYTIHSSARFLNVNPCFGIIQQSLILNDNYKVKSIIFPNKDSGNYDYYCFAEKDSTYYDKENNVLKLQTLNLPIISKAWDLTDIAAEFEKKGLVKESTDND